MWLGACDRGTPQIQVTTERTPETAAPTWAPPTATPAALQAPPADAPRVVTLDPPNGATAVDPARPTLAVTFDRAMDREGWSWVIEGPETAPELGEATFDATARTNTVQARLQPGRTYVVWVNSPQYSYFRSAQGVPSPPLRWTFTTRPAAPGQVVAGQGPGPVAAHGGPPHVVELDPPNGAVDVDAATAVLRATFDRPMEPSWSWVTEGSHFPQATGKAYFEPDARTAAMPVRLEPGQTYVIWLNSENYQLFRDLQGTPAPPLRWVFTTRASR
jgi:RNA polymerase sigma-70 factor (ECF subfamily)